MEFKFHKNDNFIIIIVLYCIIPWAVFNLLLLIIIHYQSYQFIRVVSYFKFKLIDTLNYNKLITNVLINVCYYLIKIDLYYDGGDTISFDLILHISFAYKCKFL